MAATVTGPLEPFVRGSGFEYWNRYAAVNHEFVPIHMYDSAGQEAGYPTAFGMGNLTWAYMHLALHDWFGDTAVIKKASIQMRNAVIRGTTLNVKGEITETGDVDGKTQYKVTLTVENQDGQLIAPGEATVIV